MVSAYLPSSSLTRCKWLETVQTITQQIVVDNEVLAVLMYHIERTADSTTQAPFAELMGFQKYPWRSVSASQPFVSPPLSPNSPTFTHEYASSAPVSPQSPNFPQGEETSLSSALSFSRPMYGSVPNSMHPPRMF
ncbi:hypothetical protein A0H81_04398 [Grifola frondosa]|uniref:Uncharacterized protein n=1 Tax=Grifola frondosa TaxID=5627 RepID=A0A1C7MEA0_GRIFR|nr:hypothetical protein A0H81_04398 [Grifola frondosa]